MTSKAQASNTYRPLIKKWSTHYGVDWKLVQAVLLTEQYGYNAVVSLDSPLNPSAINPADPSYGLGQILCQGATGDQHCQNRFDIERWNEATPNLLLDPDFNLQIMVQILSSNQRAYGMPKAVAVYNSYSQHTRPVYGPFDNQAYVDSVMNYFSLLGGVA